MRVEGAAGRRDEDSDAYHTGDHGEHERVAPARVAGRLRDLRRVALQRDGLDALQGRDLDAPAPRRLEQAVLRARETPSLQVILVMVLVLFLAYIVGLN